MNPRERLELARRQLARVQVASVEPTDWSDLAMYAFYALENAVVAAAEHVGAPWEPVHWRKAQLAAELHRDHGLPDVSNLLREPNELRKSEAYGDAALPASFDAEEIAAEVERYIDAVAELVGEGDP